jgi:CheY-like chemotaxis protein
MTNHVEDYLRAGFAAVVSKPVSLEDLARVITKLCPTATRTPQESVVPAQ